MDIQIIAAGNYEFPTVYMNLMDVPTYLWYEATQKRLIVEKFKRDRSAAGLPPVWPDDFDEKAWEQQHTRHFEPLKNGQIFDLGGREEEMYFYAGTYKGLILLYLTMKQDFCFSGDNISDSLWILFDTSVTVGGICSASDGYQITSVDGNCGLSQRYYFPVTIINETVEDHQLH